jgi:radical SAM protein with 4Fe4S-binding SPASM domain
LCEIGYDDLAIGADGKVYGCNMSRIEVGDLRKDDFVTIWRNSPVLARLRTIDKKDYRCSKCKYYIYCPSCIAETYILKGHYREVPREFCRLMKNNMAVKQLLE